MTTKETLAFIGEMFLLSNLMAFMIYALLRYEGF